MKVGLLDIGAAGVVLVVILLPRPDRPVDPVYQRGAARLQPQIARLQADVVRRPADAVAAERLSELLVRAGETDWAVDAAAAAAPHETPDQWRAKLAVSAVHAERLEVEDAAEWATEALTACEQAGPSGCADFERFRLENYEAALAAGLASGIDPKVDPRAFNDAVRRVVPMIKLRPESVDEKK